MNVLQAHSVVRQKIEKLDSIRLGRHRANRFSRERSSRRFGVVFGDKKNNRGHQTKRMYARLSGDWGRNPPGPPCVLLGKDDPLGGGREILDCMFTPMPLFPRWESQQVWEIVEKYRRKEVLFQVFLKSFRGDDQSLLR